ncbi:MAG: hypothetical protein IKQ20_00050 [Bacteroidales bacterium]|nr:hypothetical protein [Bacteroidales bacterium]
MIDFKKIMGSKNTSTKTIAEKIVKFASEDWFFDSVQFDENSQTFTFGVNVLSVNATLETLDDNWFRVRFDDSSNTVRFIKNTDYRSIYNLIETVKDEFFSLNDKMMLKLSGWEKSSRKKDKEVPLNTLF